MKLKGEPRAEDGQTEIATDVPFDPIWYRSFYPDVEHGIQEGRWVDALTHYRVEGSAQGRSPNPLFDEAMVRADDPALEEAIESGEFVSAVEHYARFGSKENRRVCRWVDGDWYRATYPEVQDAIDRGEEPDPYRYYLHQGRGAGHVPNPQFDATTYESVLDELDLPPLANAASSFDHYLRFGLPAGCDWPLRPALVDEPSPLKAVSARNLENFLEAGGRLRVPESSQPLVSIVLPVENQGGPLLDCLRSLSHGSLFELEVVLVVRTRDPNLLRLVDRVDGARLVTVGAETSRVAAINRGARSAQGRYLLLLDGKATLEPGSIESALEALLDDARATTVGARIIAPDRRLTSAGLSLTRTGATIALGAGEDPFDPAFSYRREAPAASEAFLLTDRSAFWRTDGLDSSLLSLSAATSDYCLRQWREEAHTLIEPRAIVWEREGTRPDVLRQTLLDRDRILIRQRHRSLLQRIEVDATRPWQGAPLVEATTGHRLLYCDDRPPVATLGSGYPRARDLLWTLCRLGWRVTVLPHWSGTRSDDQYRDLPPTLEVLDGPVDGTLEAHLDERRGHYDLLWASRPTSMSPVAKLLRKRPELFEDCRIVYDVEALFALREARRPPDAQGRSQPGTSLNAELELARHADLVVAASQVEQRWLERQGLATRWLGYSPLRSPELPDFEARSGLLMVAAIHSVDTPNYDALGWFLGRVWPQVRHRAPEMELHVAGYWAPGVPRPEIESPAVTWHGTVDDLKPLYRSARVFVAPTRYGAGIPLKILDAAAHGLPVVTTSEMADALEWSNDRELLATPASDPEMMVGEIVRLHRDHELWHSIRRQALERLEADYSPVGFEASVREVLDVLGEAEASGRVPRTDLLASAHTWISSPGTHWTSPGGLPVSSRKPGPRRSLAQTHRRAARARSLENQKLREVRTGIEPEWRCSGTLPAPVSLREVLPAPVCTDPPPFPSPLPLLQRIVRWPVRWSNRVRRALSRSLTEPLRLHREVSGSLGRLGEALERFSVETLEALRSIHADVEALAERQLTGHSDLELRLASATADITQLDTRLVTQEEEALSELSSRWIDPLPGEAPRDRVRTGNEIEALYSALQDRFRGGRELIRQRVAAFLPAVENQSSALLPLAWLDVGCGRGEWLETLKQAGVAAQGIEENAEAVSRCRTLDLPVLEAEALAYLETLDDHSLRGVSALHVIEHWEFDRIVRFLDQVQRVLAPGGLLILETPNPENLVTAALDFHYDPTHRRPVPCPLLVFLLERAGFERISPEYLTAHRNVSTVSRPPYSARSETESLLQLVETINSTLLAAPDYAVLAYRGAES